MDFRVKVDYGKELEGLCFPPILDADGQEIRFTTKVDAMNYMSKLGWEFVQAVSRTAGSISEGSGTTTSDSEWVI